MELAVPRVRAGAFGRNGRRRWAALVVLTSVTVVVAIASMLPRSHGVVSAARRVVSPLQYDILGQAPFRQCTRFVAPNGNDAASGKTLSFPWKTLNGQTGVSLSNQVICFRGGDYPLSVQSNGFNAVLADRGRLVNVVFMAYACEVPVFDGRKSFFLPVFFPGRGSFNVTVSGLHFRDIPVVSSGAIVTDHLIGGPIDGFVIENNTFTNIGAEGHGHAIYLGGGIGTEERDRTRNWTIRRNRFVNIAGGGVHSFHVNGAWKVTIEDNVFEGSQWGVLISREGQKHWVIDHNTFYNNQSGGVAVTYYSESPESAKPISDIVIRNNVGYEADGIGPFRVDQSIITDGYAQSVTEQSNTWFRASGDPLWFGGSDPPNRHISLNRYREETGLGDADRDDDPMFVDAANHDFRLTDASPSLGRGARFGQFPSCAQPVLPATTGLSTAGSSTAASSTTAPRVDASPAQRSTGGCVRFEAEEHLSRGGSQQDFYPGASNGRYVSTVDPTDTLTFITPGGPAGTWTFRLRYASAEKSTRALRVDGKPSGVIAFSPAGWGMWREISLTRKLSKGTHEVVVTGAGGYLQQDYLEICPPRR